MSEAPPSPSPCPSEEVFVALADGDLEEEAREALDRHVDRCGACSQLLADLVDLGAPLQDTLPTPAGPVAPPRVGSSPRPTAGSPQEQLVGGRYAIQRMVGRGGMGSVYEAYDESLGRKVAIKVLRGDLVDAAQREEHSARLLREARLLAAVHHPNVLNVYDVGVFERQVYLAIQYVEGTTLREWIRDTAPDWRSLLDVYLAVGDGLFAAHKQGLVHRDIKPDNILIDATGRAWLADFGLACAIGAQVVVDDTSEADGEPIDLDLTLSAVTRTGAVMGTPAYMAPEQHLAQETDERSDQFSLAAAIFESLYGQRAFEGRTRPALAAAVTEGRLVSPPAGDVPSAILPVLRRALAPERTQRFATLEEFLEALAQAADPGRPWYRRGLPPWAAAALGVGLTALVMVAVSPSGDAPGPVAPIAVQPDAPPVARPAPSVDASAPTPVAAPGLRKHLAEVELLATENAACRRDAEACDALVDHLQRCCIDSAIETVPTHLEKAFKRGSEGLVERFFTMCRAGRTAACAPAAFAYALSYHDYTYPEGNLVPKYLGAMRAACEGGDFVGCAIMQDVYADGGFRDEGAFSVPADQETFITILDAACRNGLPRACWLIAESLLTASSFERTAEQDRRALEFAARSCDGGWAQACLLGGLAYRDLPPDACAADTRPVMSKIPSNDLFDYTASWSDVAPFCKRFAPLADGQKARALFATGCKAPPEAGDRSASALQRKSIALSCGRLEALPAAAEEPVEEK